VPATIDRSEGSTFAFPLGCRLGSDCWLGNYRDRDRRSGAQRDFNGGALTYDQHEGTDYLVNGFAAMDLGVDVLAAAAGIVVLAEDSFPDRCTDNCPAATENYVFLGHADGKVSTYFHLRKGSVVVAPGETVRRGQKIAEVGSSGNSTDPHLHFDWLEPHSMTYLDPFTTTDDAYVTPWEAPSPYQGYDGVSVARIALSRQLVELASWSLDPPAAAALRTGESIFIYAYVVRPEQGRHYAIQLRDGTGTVRETVTEIPDASAAYFWLPVPVTLAGPAGEWEIRLLDGESLVKKMRFQVQ
jgi:murein DD-endopeptidase MepM/ murein hydrolase activator NlpD